MTHPSRSSVGFRTEVLPADAAAVRALVAATGFFHAGEVDVAEELVRERLARGASSGYSFVFAEADGRLAGYACHGPIACTQGSHDLYWIAVAPALQGRGLGKQLLERVVAHLRAEGGRRLYVDTSNRSQYAPTRAFYEAAGLRQAAVLEDFYAPGDDKVIYALDLEVPAVRPGEGGT